VKKLIVESSMMAKTHLHLTVRELVEKLLKLNQNNEIRYEYDSSSCSLYWLEIKEEDENTYIIVP
jgi:hypothetical protein